MNGADSARPLMTGIADALVSVIFAPHCAGCARVLEHPLEGAVCASCWMNIPLLSPPLCRTCGDMLPSWRAISVEMERCAACRRRPGAIDAGRAIGMYEGELRAIVHAFKYEGRRTIGRRLGDMLRLTSADLLSDVRAVVPVPLHPWRRLTRGFNQAADLAHALDLPVVHALWRSRATSPQAGLTASARRRNVRGAFRLSPFVRVKTLDSYVAGQRVVLVDDVWTTGATLNECARVLKEAGAAEVRAVTVARAKAPRATGKNSDLDSAQPQREADVRSKHADRRHTRDLHALNEDGMVVCNPRDKEAAHRADMEGIATADHAAVTCRKCIDLLYKHKRRNEGQTS